MKPHLVNRGHIHRDGDLTRLTIPPTSNATYVDAQLDDYDHDARLFGNVAPQRMHIHVRFSHPAGVLKGTSGFGFWNHPFTQAGNLIDLPTNLWFFYSSPESDMQVARGLPGHGFKAAVLSSPLPTSRTSPPEEEQSGGPLSESVRPTGPAYLGRTDSKSHIGAAPAVMSAMVTQLAVAVGNLALRLPLISKLAMAAAQRIVTANEAPLNIDMTQWHEYDLLWLRDEVVFRINEHEVLRTSKPPRGPLGFVAWIDNYRATAARGRYEFGYVDVKEEQWIELKIQN